MVNPLLVLFIALSLAYVLSELLKRFRLPRVIGQLTAGFLLGLPFLKDYFFPAEMRTIFSFFADIGIILLFYFIGLETSLREFRKFAKKAFFISFFNTSIPLAAGFLVSLYFFHLSPVVSLIVGISLAVSAQAVSLDILEEAKLLKSSIANLIITAGAVDDVFEFLLISVLLIVFHVAAGTADLFIVALGIAAFLGSLFLLRFLLIPFILRQLERDKSATTLFMGSLLIVVFIAYLADVFKIGSLIGALVAGILVRQTLLKGEHRKPWEEHAIAKSIHLISFGLFVPLFFVWVGVNTTFVGAAASALFIGTLIFINVAGTILGTVIGVRAAGGTFKEGFLVGCGVLPKGDTELVIATLALAGGIISTTIFSGIVLSAFIVTLVAPIAFNILVKKERRYILRTKV